LLVLWLPAVGNLITYLVRKIPQRPPKPAPDFSAGSVFTPQLQVRLQPTGLVPDLAAALASTGHHCTLVVGHNGFTARVGGVLPSGPEENVAVELLRPEVALRHLAPGTEFRLLVGTTVAAKGRVAEVVGAR
jgi:hypothetical protein